MIFISAQPDEFYFYWQIKLLLNNLNSFGVRKEAIHVLIGYNPKKGLSKIFQGFIKKNKQALFYPYPDFREDCRYDSTIRPYMLAKHLKYYPELQNETLFYHDSDILFNKKPNFNNLTKNDCWYASPTYYYTSANFIETEAGISLVEDICNIIGVQPSLIKENDFRSGGAQYILKKTSPEFWEKVEKDSEKIFNHLSRYAHDNPKTKIQPWCADMWAVWWNAILFNKKIDVHSSLEFSWATDQYEDILKKNIVHYTGKINLNSTHLFRKSNYHYCSPFDQNLDQISTKYAGFRVVEEISKVIKNELLKRTKLTDVTILIPVRIDSEERLKNLWILLRFLDKHFLINVSILEADTYPKINQSILPKNINYFFVEDFDDNFHRTKYFNELIQLTQTPIIALYDVDVIISPKQMIKAVHLLRNQDYDAISPYSGTFYNLNYLLKEMFSKLIETNFLENNLGKLTVSSERSLGGVILIKKESYLQAGLENQNLIKWGPDDIERWKRLIILDYKVGRIEGSLFHLPHPRLANSKYSNPSEHNQGMQEYFKITKMTKNELKNYVKSWRWIRDDQQ